MTENVVTPAGRGRVELTCGEVAIAARRVRFRRLFTPIPVNVWGVGYRLTDAERLEVAA